MKKILLFLVIAGLVVAAIFSWLLLGPATSFNEKSRYLYIGTGKANKAAVIDSIEQNRLLAHPGLFEKLATRMHVWERLKPGRFRLKKGQSLLSIARMLRNNNQSPVNLVINKLRTREDLASLIGKNFEADSASVMSFLTNPDSLAKLNVNEYTAMTLIIPNTYTLYWTTPVPKIFNRLSAEQQNFWKKKNRLQKAAGMEFSPAQVYTISSIVEEETNKNDEKGKIASVYINRYHKPMKLGADPTIKFALKDFSIKRVTYDHLKVESPFNTYKNYGLPPGPICTPSPKTIDAVLDAPKTDYLYFVAKSDFSGYHTFTSIYAEHVKYANEYRKALDEYLLRKQNNP